jgi:tetratricopeptide (TPR) repeat protein
MKPDSAIEPLRLAESSEAPTVQTAIPTASAEQRLGEIQSSTAESTLLQEVGRLVVALNRAYPEPKNNWSDRAYAKVKSVTNYIGIPGLIIAAIFPVYNLVDASVNYLNKEFVHSVYTAYAMELLEHGEIERADQVISDLEYADKHDVKTLYANAKVLTKMAIKQGKRQQEATDRTNVLLLLQRGKSPWFPRVGKKDEIFDLELGLVDIDIQLQKYDDAFKRIEDLEKSVGGVALWWQPWSGHSPRQKSPEQLGQLLLRKGTVYVLQFHYPEAEANLKQALDLLKSDIDRSSLAECYFQTGKLYQFMSKSDVAVQNYAQALRMFESLNDSYALLKGLQQSWDDSSK